MKRQLHLNAFLLGAGHHLSAWRHPDSQIDAGLNIDNIKKIIQTAERGKLDAVFFADILGIAPTKDPDVRAQTVNYIGFEPITLLSYLAAHTSHIGLIGTVSTAYSQPYHLARKLASLDLLSGGRAGWNIVTSATDFEANLFGFDKQKIHSERYEIAREFVDVVKALWHSFDFDAFEFDKKQARFLNPDKVHEIDFDGKYFKVRGLLNVPRSPQGHPVLVQAGSSEDGQDLAAYSGEVIFTAQQNLADAQKFYKSLKSKLDKYGRNHDDLSILPGICPIIGNTIEEAKLKYEELQELIPDASGKNIFSWLEIDFDKYPLDGPFPYLPLIEGVQSRQQLVADLAKRENLTIRQVFQRVASARGHFTVYGTPTIIADHIQEWFENDAADGFNIMPSILPTGLDDFVNLVVPELQRRGIFRHEYESNTLRGNLGLKKP